MPRLFYKVVVGFLFAAASVAALAVEAAICIWLAGQYPNPLAWIAYVLFAFIDVAALGALFRFAAEKVKRA